MITKDLATYLWQEAQDATKNTQRSRQPVIRQRGEPGKISPLNVRIKNDLAIVEEVISSKRLLVTPASLGRANAPIRGVFLSVTTLTLNDLVLLLRGHFGPPSRSGAGAGAGSHFWGPSTKPQCTPLSRNPSRQFRSTPESAKTAFPCYGCLCCDLRKGKKNS